ncbi:MAG: alpha/beta hydrolase [Bacteroidetes bacterium]|nr:alpha/beta hydrolase [Fibrella sp.]
MFLVKLVPVMLVLSMLTLSPTGCKKAAPADVVAVPKSALVSSDLIGQYSADQLKSRYNGASSVFRVLIRYGIKVYRVVYTTTNTDGRTIRASGALIIPDTQSAVSLISQQHGTITDDNAAPSYYKTSSESYSFGSVFSSQGYIIAAPDYIGYGVSKDLPHPYEHRSSLATASLDMLRAAREFLEANRITGAKANWDGRLFLAGYSEGGYATMALQKKLEEDPDEFNLVASSCGAGAYHKSAFMREIINTKTSSASSITRLYVWVLLTYDRIYGLNRPMTYYFKEPYAARIATEGYRAEISVSLNETLTDSFKKAINDGTDTAFLNAVADNDIHDWQPRKPTRLYHGDADVTVSYINSANAYTAMKARGATNVALIPIRNANHATGLPAYILGTYGFFSEVQ